MNRPLRVALLPAASEGHPYLRALGAALEGEGVAVVPGFPFRFGALLGRRREVDVLHLHWPGYFYRSGPGALLPVRLAVYVAKLLLARGLGYRIVWTVHNLVPHEGPGWVARADRWALSRTAHALICHCRAVADSVGRTLGRNRGVFVVPHGPLPAAPLPPAGPEARVRARAFLRVPPDAFLYVFVGEVRPYKGVEDLLAAFGGGTEGTLLLVAGAPRDAGLAARVRETAGRSPRVRALLRRLPEHRLVALVRAADAVVLPYRRVTTSGLLHLALAVGAPIVAPALGCIPEAVDARLAVLYDPADPRGLAGALEKVRSLDPATARAACRERAAETGWDAIARRTRRVYEGAEPEP